MDAKLKHLEFIQGIVNRLATDSFRLKGWTVVLVSALVVLLAREGRIEIAPVALVPVIVFWGLDGYFLWQERLFRALYDHVRQLEESEIDFSMDVSPFRTNRARTWLSATFSRTLIGFYGALAMFAVGLVVLHQLIAGGCSQMARRVFSVSSTSTTYLAPWSSARAGSCRAGRQLVS